MKIDKVYFSSSETFSVFWNLNSKVYSRLGIEPVCLLFGKKANTNMNEDYGKVIEMPIIKDIPLLIQITWSKFHWATLEPEVTSLIGDIDLMPLSRYRFIDDIKDVPEDTYVHLDADGITQLSRVEHTWTGRELNENNMADFGCPSNMPGHYHCAKGKIMKIALEEHRGSFENELKYIVNSGKYNNTRGYREEDPIDQCNLWCAEELRSTRAIRRQIAQKNINFKGFFLKHGIDRTDGDRLDKMYNPEKGECGYDLERLVSGKYADIHCIRPFSHCVSKEECDKMWSAIEKVLKLAKMID